MRKTLFIVCMLAMALSAFSQDYLKLMSYNVRNTKGMDGVRNYQRIANVIINESPDVVAIQELDSMTTRSEQKYVLGELAERTQMHGNYVPAISFQGGKYGIGIVHYAIRSAKNSCKQRLRKEKKLCLFYRFKTSAFRMTEPPYCRTFHTSLKKEKCTAL